MAETVFILTLLIPAVLGVAEILHAVKQYLYSYKKIGGQILLLIPNDNNLRLQLESAANQRDWYGKAYPQKILVLPYNLTLENRYECEKLARKLQFEMCEIDDLKRHFM